MKLSECSVLGRPREFDIEAALAAALKVFWRKGYDGASLSDLTEAMGVTRPSLYCAFGNKEALFRKALELYEREKLAYIDRVLEAPTAYEAVERLLFSAIDTYTNAETPGCMGVNSILSCSAAGAAADSVRLELDRLRSTIATKLQDRLVRAKAEGDLPAHCDPAGLTFYFLTLSQGMAIQASTGAGRAALRDMVATALQAWPRREVAA